MHWAAQSLLLMIRALPFFILTQTGDFYPEQIKLSWSRHENELTVTWVTYLKSNTYATLAPFMCDEAGEVFLVQGHSEIFNAGSDAVPRYQIIHKATLKPILEHCFYEYKVGNLVYWSKPFVVRGRTPDAMVPFDYESPITLLVVGDLGVGPIAKETMNILVRDAEVGHFDALIHLGDIAYNLNSDFGRVGDQFIRMIQPVASKYPYLTIPGNHEHDDNMTHYKMRFDMPVNSANDGTGYFYSLDMGPAHFIFFNTEIVLSSHHLEANLTQWNWLVEDIEKARANREDRPWIIMGTHHPLYCSVDYMEEDLDKDCAEEGSELQAVLDEFLYNNRIDLFLQAHVHNYERAGPVYRNLTVSSDYDSLNMHVNPKAPVYITTGNAGNHKGQNDPISRTPQLWSLVRSDTYGYGRLKVYNKTHLYYEQTSAPNSETVDYVWIVKNHTEYEVRH
mmetsp:Transcript_32628/g.56686  ORF Transcript_32628/g.56686 Transcript_32628/m.56686 type:complete len:449 (+) Transcript_32628:1585-2931(+)